MKNRLTNICIILAVTITCLSCNHKTKDIDNTIIDTTEVNTYIENVEFVFATKAESASFLGKSDIYTKELSLFDIQSKAGLGATSETDYLNNAVKEAREWTETEKAQTRLSINAVLKNIKDLGLKLKIPKKVYLVKTTLNEEGNAGGYTRSNYIVLGEAASINLFAHELFHIYSRANPVMKDELYKTIHFEKCNIISLDVLNDMNISNPDAPVIEHSIKVNINGEPKDVVFVIYSKRNYTTGSFFNYINQGLMELEGKGMNKKVKLLNDKPIIKTFRNASNLYDLIGKNTNYNIHPEEVMAEHFMYLITKQNVSEQKYINAIEEILKK